MATTYWDYIRVEELLKLQGGLEDDDSGLSNHEVLFITVHQVFELWFKLVIREMGALRDFFHKNPVPDQDMGLAAQSVDRMVTILRVASDHFQVVETLNTRDYLDFRDKLFPASGFQSAQMRQLEILMGLEDEERIGLGRPAGYMKALQGDVGDASPAYQRVTASHADAPTLKEAVGEWLYRTPIRGSQPGDERDAETVDAFLASYLERYEHSVRRLMAHVRKSGGEASDPDTFDKQSEREIESTREFCRGDDARHRRIRAAILFIESYRELPLLTWPRTVLAGMLALEQAFVIFRQRHARMVERVIGRRTGTGGSSGVDYLDETATTYRVFKDLWAVRTILLRRGDLPPIEDTRFYEFRAT